MQTREQSLADLKAILNHLGPGAWLHIDDRWMEHAFGLDKKAAAQAAKNFAQSTNVYLDTSRTLAVAAKESEFLGVNISKRMGMPKQPKRPRDTNELAKRSRYRYWRDRRPRTHSL